MIWRTIFELSSMYNNDEWVHHGDHEIGYEECANLIRRPFCKPRLRISRPVHPEELKAGLDVEYQGPIFGPDGEGVPKVTCCLDSLYKFHERLSFYMQGEGDPGEILASIIGDEFYDCMSGGTSIYFLAMARELIERHNIPLTLDVYPKHSSDGLGWHTLEDFLKEIENVPRLGHLLPSSVDLQELKLLP